MSQIYWPQSLEFKCSHIAERPCVPSSLVPVKRYGQTSGKFIVKFKDVNVGILPSTLSIVTSLSGISSTASQVGFYSIFWMPSLQVTSTLIPSTYSTFSPFLKMASYVQHVPFSASILMHFSLNVTKCPRQDWSTLASSASTRMLSSLY